MSNSESANEECCPSLTFIFVKNLNLLTARISFLFPIFRLVIHGHGEEKSSSPSRSLYVTQRLQGGKGFEPSDV